MPPTQEMIKKALECLENVGVEFFRAEPTTIRPFGPGAKLSWQIVRPTDCVGMIFTLNGSNVSTSGSRTVTPGSTTTYRLEGSMSTIRNTLASVTVTMDTGGCFSGSIPEADIRQRVQDALAQQISASSRLSERSPASVEIDANGIAVMLRLKISIENFADPDLNINFTIGLRGADGRAVASLSNFGTQVDWPWWVTVITLGVSEIIEGVIENEIEGKVKPELLNAVQELLDDNLLIIPPTHRLFSIRTVTDGISFTVCPVS